MLRRTSQQPSGPNVAMDIEHNNPAGGKKVIPQMGFLEYVGSGSSAQNFLIGSVVWIWNGDTVVRYATMGISAAVVAGTAPGANIIPLKPSDWTAICLGSNTNLIANNALVHFYRLVDDTTVQVISEP